MTASVLQNANDLAIRSVKLAHDILTDQPHDDKQMIVAELIDKDNDDQFIALQKKLGNIK